MLFMNNSQVGAYFNYYYFFVIQKKFLVLKKIDLQNVLGIHNIKILNRIWSGC